MTHDERMHELLYSNDGRVELCERIEAIALFNTRFDAPKQRRLEV